MLSGGDNLVWWRPGRRRCAGASGGEALGWGWQQCTDMTARTRRGEADMTELARNPMVNPTWRARLRIPISAMDLGLIWRVPLSPGVWAGYGDIDSVCRFCVWTLTGQPFRAFGTSMGVPVVDDLRNYIQAAIQY